MKKAELLPAPRIDLAPARNKWEREYRAFLRLRPSLLRTHRNKYVAIHEGQVVGAGKDKIELALRVYDKFGYIPIYVGQVTMKPRPFRIPSPRLVRTSVAE
ncbi:MAG: hypothetical protein FJ403_00600 [Verrucomicrobia bacterium]|nr:hypothetical protein [Verrucomicrobiota bacterium]